MTKTLTEAVAAFLGPIMAEYARLIDEGDPEIEVSVRFGSYEHKTTLQTFQDLDRAYAAAFERNQKAACYRRDRKAAGSLL